MYVTIFHHLSNKPRTKFGAAHPSREDKTVMAASASIAPANTCIAHSHNPFKFYPSIERLRSTIDTITNQSIAYFPNNTMHCILVLISTQSHFCVHEAEHQQEHCPTCPWISKRQHTSFLEFFIAITAAIKNVLSPISDARITPHDFRNPSTNLFAITLLLIFVTIFSSIDYIDTL